MEPERWAKICWSEIKRGIKNNKETDWGGGMRKRLAKLGTDWRGIMAKEREMIQDMENLITIDMEQTIQEDWARWSARNIVHISKD